MTASDPSGNQSSAQPIMVTVVNEYLETIDNLALSSNENMLSLSWDSPFDAGSFKIYRDGQFLIEVSDQTYDDIVDPN